MTILLEDSLNRTLVRPLPFSINSPDGAGEHRCEKNPGKKWDSGTGGDGVDALSLTDLLRGARDHCGGGDRTKSEVSALEEKGAPAADLGDVPS
jgi:hypothetical protein